MSIRIIGDTLPNIPWQEKEDESHSPAWRYSNNPIIKRNPTKSAARIFNSAVVPFNGQFAGVFRADHKHMQPFLHAGFSRDGLNWDIDGEPIHWVDEEGNDYPMGRFEYDPRVVKVDDVYYIIWCCDFAGCYAIGLGWTVDFKKFVRLKNPFIPFNRNGVLFPRKINGNYLMLSRPSDNGHTQFGDIFVSESPDLTYWGNHRLVMRSGINWWQSTKIGAGPAPIETDKGWLLFYHGVITNCNGFVYSIGAALLDIDEPYKVLLRTNKYILTPEVDYETNGFVPNVCFPCAALADADTGRIVIYYGASDTYTALAFTTVKELYDFMLENNELGIDDGRVVR